MERNIDQINVIPLVDVMLVLLVIVLTTATFISTGQIPVNLAKAKEVSDHKDVPIVISLTADGNLFLNDARFPPEVSPPSWAPGLANRPWSCERTRSHCSRNSSPWSMRFVA